MKPSTTRNSVDVVFTILPTQLGRFKNMQHISKFFKMPDFRQIFPQQKQVDSF